MGDMFRSEEMALCQMFIQPEAAYASIAQLGEHGCVQFRDLNGEVSAFHRKFVTEVRRCDELERKIRYIETQIRKDDIVMQAIEEEEEPLAPNPREIIDLEAQLEMIESEIKELSSNEVNLNSNYISCDELRRVLQNTEGFFSAQEVLNLDANRPVDPNDPTGVVSQQRGQLGFVAGVIKLEKFFAFERMLWRISRGNVFVKRSDMSGMSKDPVTGHPTLKTVFVAFFQGEELKQRIKKVCAGFHASVYPCPSAHSEREEMIKDVKVRLEDYKLVLNQTADHRNRVLVAASKNLPVWSIMVKKMKAIYHILNLFNADASNKCLVGEGWVPSQDLPIVQRALAEGSKSVESAIPSFLNVIATDEQPPTFTRTNRFTRGFQNLIDSYGMASYREVNPALYTCISFPFLFAVMFGDIGHGLVLVLTASYLCLNEVKLGKIKEEIFNIFFGGRYIILLMGLFSLYTGFIYNDIFSKSMNIFGSGWNVTKEDFSDHAVQLHPGHNYRSTYIMGLDPIWQLAENKIIFLNTYKMKLSIIFGVAHMTFGVCMALVNHAYFKRWSRIFLEFIPQILFLLLLFGYMCFMMIYKMIMYSDKTGIQAESPGCAPSILILFINMMLFKSSDVLEGCNEFMFEGQKDLQMILVFVALACIPWMLLGTPLYIILKPKFIAFYKLCVRLLGLCIPCLKRKHANEPATPPPETAADKPTAGASHGGGHGHGHGEDEPLSEIFMQQAIHTIEYVLSTISHTASYLRLWALSLAHAQLSEVLWSMILNIGFGFDQYYGAAVLYFVFGAWSTLTVGILVVIEGLSAFLHTLRLHWVEFMSKFYEGLGYAFEPFSFRVILDGNDEA